MAKTDLPSVNKRIAEEKKAAEVKEEAAAKSAPRGEGKVLVRLIRPLLIRSGVLLQPGLHELLEGEVPKSAKRIDAD